MEGTLPTCPVTGLAIPECSCERCHEERHRQFLLYYARREARDISRGRPSPEQVGRRQAREQIAHQTGRR